MALMSDEVSAANQQRRYEDLSESPVGGVLESGVSVAAAAVALGNSLTMGGPTGLAVAGSIVAGLGIVDWFRRLGNSKVRENLEALGQATEDALNRVEKLLLEQGTTIEEIGQRLESDDFRDAVASASLQALRTTQQDRLRKLALVLANGVKDNDLAPANTDDMMRAAVELGERDVALLKRIYELQAYVIRDSASSDSDRLHRIAQDWIARTKLRPENGGIELANCRGSVARLQAQAFVQLRTPGFDAGAEIVVLLPDGAKFYERLQEIGDH
jgi:hypothetical protein